MADKINDSAQENTEKETRKINVWVRFSGMGLQLGACITLFTLLGQWIDTKTSMKTPVFTIILSLFGVGIGLYIVIKDIIKMNKK